MVDAEKRLPLVDAIKDEQVRNTIQRQELIKQIQQELGNKRLIVYTANFHHPNSSMQHSDITPFEELLIDVGTTEDLYLILKNHYASIAISLGKNTVTLVIKRIFVIFVERKVTPHMESLFAIIVIKIK